MPHVAHRLHSDPPPGRNRILHGMSWHTKRAPAGPTRLSIKNHFIACVGEYVGTTMFLFLALGGTNVANIPSTSVTGGTQSGQDGSAAASPNTSNLLYIALSFGFSLAVNAWVFFRVSGGLFNPAVSLGMALSGVLTPVRAALLTLAQILGGITGAALIQVLLPGTLNVRTTLSPGMSVARGLFLEMFLTSFLMLTILLLAAEKSKATFLAPIGIGLALFVAELVGVYWTGGSLNPARSFGPCVVLRTFDSSHWLYWVGPALGAALASGFYRFIKWLEYETVLGPEDGDPSTTPARGQRPAQLDAPAPTMLGRSGAPAGALPVTKTAQAISTSTGEKNAAPNEAETGLAVQGPGLADLLTHGSPTAVLALEGQVGEYTHRLDSIERMLESLLMRDGRKPSTDGTVVEGGLASPLTHTLPASHALNEHEWRKQSDTSPV